MGYIKDYILEKSPLGAGGYAEVYRATHRTSRGVVAMKRPFKDDEAKGRLRREIDIQQKLSHPNIMPILDSNPTELWFCMPIAAGTFASLRDQLDDADLPAIFEQLCSALEYAHNQGFIHRDISPSNILAIDSDEGRSWVIADWGLVRRPRGETTRLRTAAGRSFGTQGFSAPEMWTDAHAADLRADVYSLGRVVAWAISGQWPAPNLPLLPEGRWRSLVQAATQTNVSNRLNNLAEFRIEMRHALTTEVPSPEEIAEKLLDKDDDAAHRRLLELALANPDNAELYFDFIPQIKEKQILSIIKKDPASGIKLAQAMCTHLCSSPWSGRDFNHANNCLLTIFQITKYAAESQQLEVLQDASTALFKAETHWHRYDQRNRTRAWLSGLAGEAAGTVSRVLARFPDAAEWYKKEWRNPRVGDKRIAKTLGITP